MWMKPLSPCMSIHTFYGSIFRRPSWRTMILLRSMILLPATWQSHCTLTKEKSGELFRDLDLLAKLLAPRKTTKITTNIEVISSSSDTENQLNGPSSGQISFNFEFQLQRQWFRLQTFGQALSTFNFDFNFDILTSNFGFRLRSSNFKFWF